jgi:hypothetical protein
MATPAHNAAAEGSLARWPHPTNAKVASRIERILLGVHAGAARSELHRLDPEPMVLYVGRLPVWLWTPPKRPMGRKAQAPGGGSYLFPVRVIWDDLGHQEAPNLICSPEAPPAELAWSATGLGRQMSGKTPVVVTAAPPPRHTPSQRELPTTISVHKVRTSVAARWLDAAAADGADAQWELLDIVGTWTMNALHKAHTSLAKELHGESGGDLVDVVDLEGIRDQMVLGNAKDVMASTVGRIVSQCLRPTAVTSADLERHIWMSVCREATASLRRHIGDNNLGTKVRRIADAHGTRDPDEVVAVYGEVYPADRLGRQRAIAALYVAHDPPTPALPMDPHTLPYVAHRQHQR